MSKFKVGDKVVCVDDEGHLHGVIEVGKIYTVTGGDSTTVSLAEIGSYWKPKESRFEIYQEPTKEEPTVTHKFKVGDKVKCIDAAPYNILKTGNIYTVADTSEPELIYLKELMGGYCLTRFELFLEAPQGNPFTPPDAVNPNHYTQFAIQPLTYIRANGLNFTRGNIVKYATRAGFKDGSEDIEDLEKIIRYAQAEIEAIKRERDVRNGLADVYEVWNKAI